MANNTGKDGVGDRGQRDIEASERGGQSEAGSEPIGNAAEAGTDYDFLRILQAAKVQNEQFLAAVQRTSWQQTIRAYRNQHLVGSKYTSAPYRNRSKIFRPKIRTAVRKNLAAAASALFSTADVVQIKAEHDSDPIKQASAGVLKEVVNYRLDRTAVKSGIPWFLMSMAANLDAQLMGVCVSKQFWEYEVSIESHDVDIEEEIDEPVLDEETGAPMFDLTTGEPMMTTRVEQRTETEDTEHVIRDRPMIMTLPPEHVEIDPAAPWYDPVQLSPYFVAKFPMAMEDALTMIGNPGRSGTEWLDLDEEQLRKVSIDHQSKTVRTERSGGIDRLDSGAGRDNGEIVWFHENFVRVGGVDYCFWSIGTQMYASKIRTTREAYPEQFGDRPYTYGYGQIESHTIAPMSMAESLMPLQIEANDVVNLRLDANKQALSPIAVVRQGTVFDWKQLQHRGSADSTVIVKNVDDLRFETTPSSNQQSFQEMNLLNVDMDDLSGSFSGSSVQYNRQLNETVGGMRLLSGSANSVTEFDLRVWVETWTEPALRQAVRCIQYYEDDERILALAGDKAKMFERYGVDSITDADLESEVSVAVNVGIGSADPMQKLAKFSMAMETIAKAAPYMDKPRKLNAEEFIKEVMGDAGYNDGMRFFVDMDEAGAEEPPPPEVIEMQLQHQLEQEKLKLEDKIASEKNATTLENTARKGRLDLINTLIGAIADEQRTSQEISVNRAIGATNTMADLFKTRMTADARQQPQERRV